MTKSTWNPGIACALALAALTCQRAGAQAYSVSLQADADQNQTNYTDLVLTTISGSQSANTSSAGPPSGTGSATSVGAAAIGSLSGTAGATGTGGGGGDAIIETQFTDTVTLSAGLYKLLYVPSGAVSAAGGTNTSATAFTQATFTASALTGIGTTESFSQNICAKEVNGAAISCGGGWQANPTTTSVTLDVTKSGSCSQAVCVSYPLPSMLGPRFDVDRASNSQSDNSGIPAVPYSRAVRRRTSSDAGHRRGRYPRLIFRAA